MSGRWTVRKMRPGTGWLSTCPAETHGEGWMTKTDCWCDWHYTWWGAMNHANRCLWREWQARRP